MLRWGATDRGGRSPCPEMTSSRAPTSARPAPSPFAPSADQVWPWIAQLGQGRGGFYSYDFLENLVGCDIHSADRIVSEWQNVKIGDEVKLHPEVALEVAGARSGAITRRARRGSDGEYPAALRLHLVFHPSGSPDRTTRLLVRERYAYTRRWARLLVEPVEAISFVMSQKMLRGIRDRAEQVA